MDDEELLVEAFLPHDGSSGASHSAASLSPAGRTATTRPRAATPHFPFDDRPESMRPSSTG